MPDTFIGAREDWDQTFNVLVGGSTPGLFTLTPKTPKVRIWYTDALGVTRYWNGTAFATSGTPIDLATTILGKRSTYPFTVPTGVDGQTLQFLGWTHGDLTTGKDSYRTRTVATAAQAVLELAFKPGF